MSPLRLSGHNSVITATLVQRAFLVNQRCLLYALYHPENVLYHTLMIQWELHEQEKESAMPTPNIALPMGDRKISQLLSNQNTETGVELRKVIDSRLVVRSTDPDLPRPNAPVIFWIGGSTQPTNMEEGDLWFKTTGITDPSPEPPLADNIPPTAPTQLSVSSTTPQGFSLSWTPSSDNVAVTGYEVSLNNIVKASPTAAAAQITGLSPNTTYSVTIRARDAVGNWSPSSTPVQTQTSSEAPSTAKTFSVFGSAPHPGTLTKYTETPVTIATGFYTYGNAPGWRAVGMRLFIPLGIELPSTAECGLWNSAPPNLAGTPDRVATMTNITAGQWNEILWETPMEVTTAKRFYCSYNFGTGVYIAAPSNGDSFTLSSDTSNFVLSDAGTTELEQRSWVYYTGGATVPTGSLYGIDAIIDKGA